jgi:hypothetical protein
VFRPKVANRRLLVSTAQKQLEADFKTFAKSQGITPRRQADFASDTEFLVFAISVQACYNRFTLYRDTSIARYEAEVRKQGGAARRGGGVVGLVRRWVQGTSEWIA